MGKVPLPQVRRAHLPQRLLRLTHLRRFRLLEGVHLAAGAHQHRVQHRVAEGGGVDLGDIGDTPRPLTGRHGGQIKAVDGDLSGAGRQRAQNTPEQGGFPHAVGAQHRQQLSLLRGEGHVPQHGMLSVGEGQVFHRKAHSTCSFLVIR